MKIRTSNPPSAIHVGSDRSPRPHAASSSNTFRGGEPLGKPTGSTNHDQDHHDHQDQEDQWMDNKPARKCDHDQDQDQSKQQIQCQLPSNQL